MPLAFVDMRLPGPTEPRAPTAEWRRPRVTGEADTEAAATPEEVALRPGDGRDGVKSPAAVEDPRCAEAIGTPRLARRLMRQQVSSKCPLAPKSQKAVRENG